MENTDQLSVLISSMLDSMGFSRHMIDFRINNALYFNVKGSLENDLIGCIMTGGKAEGTSQWRLGDVDMMMVRKFITVSGRHFDPPSPQQTVFYTEDCGVHPGYTLLRLGHRGIMDTIMQQSLISLVIPNSVITYYLSSSVFKQTDQQFKMQIHTSDMQHRQISGPSQPIIISGKETDTVVAFPHPDFPVQASQWMNRCRTKGWPPESIVTAIVQSGCHIVAKGFKGSPSEHMEWNISFAVHEQSIVQLFNMTQKHVYILLKFIAKDLKESLPVLRDLVTSYTMKTVVLWQVELHHTREWDRYHLLDRLMEALDFLKSCVESQNLPAYFIPENNLFDGKINDFTAALLSRLLNNLMCQGTVCVCLFPSIQEQIEIMRIPGMRYSLDAYASGLEMDNLIQSLCSAYTYLCVEHILPVLSMIDSPDMSRLRLFTNGTSKTLKATLAYINIAIVKKARMSNRRKYELYRSLCHIASANIDIDRISGKVKFAGMLHVLGKTNEAIETLYSITKRTPFDVSRKNHCRTIIRKKSVTKKVSDDIEAAIKRLGRYRYEQQCVSLDVFYIIEEIDIVPNVIKYELFHVPERRMSKRRAYVDPDMLRYYLLYKCHTELGDEANAQAAFINLIRIATLESFDPYMEYREVALNVLGLCYLENEDYLRSYICFCRAMSLRPRLLVKQMSTSTPWHLAVLASKLINRSSNIGFYPEIFCPYYQKDPSIDDSSRSAGNIGQKLDVTIIGFLIIYTQTPRSCIQRDRKSTNAAIT